MKVRILNGAAHGTYTDDFNDTIAKDWVFTNIIPSSDLFKPLWDEQKQEWYEGEKQEIINQKLTNKLNQELSNICFASRLWAKAIAMDKTINDDLDYFEDVYTEKYNQCKDLDGVFDYFLELEANAEGYTRLTDYKQLVIQKYEAGLSFFQQAKAMLEVFRKVVLLDIDNKNFTQAKSKITNLDALPNDISPTDFATEFQRIINL